MSAEPPSETPTPIVAAVRARTSGFLAVVHREGRLRLVASDRATLGGSPATVLAAVEAATDQDVPLDGSAVDDVLTQLRDWCDERVALDSLNLPVSAPAVARRRLLRRIDTIASRSPRHLRSHYVALARQARRAATLTFGAGAEQVLEALAGAPMPDDAWLNAVRTFAQIHTRPDADGPAEVRALLVLVPPTSAAAAPPP
ncbi:MAG: hypothetical protein ACRENQ_15920 [Gemmatimonadaceae bacterium]